MRKLPISAQEEVLHFVKFFAQRFTDEGKEVVDEENLFLAAVKAMRGLEDEDVAEYGEADLKEKWQ